LPKPARNSGKGWVKIRLALEIGVNLEFLFARDRQNFVGFGQSAAIYFQKMTSDLDLLRQFARENSQDDFTEIVRRHVNLVYSAALRQVRSPQLAEEIAQSVFADLARDANKLKPDTIVTAWLYSVTRRTAIDVIRKESRRQLREQIAVEMNNMNATESRTGVPPVWSEIEKYLDDAMAALDETDRAAILLRYFENKNLREVGESLNISNDAAQKRVSRAVERLREFFSKRNVTIGASGLAVLISANAVQSAPVGLAATISAAAVLAGTAVHTSTVIAATKTIAMTTLQKTVITTALAATVGTGIFEAHQTAQLRDEVQTLQQQQTPLAAQIQQSGQSLADATNQLAGLLAENARLKSNSNENELLKLRAEVTQLKVVQVQGRNSSMEVMADAWVKRVEQFKQYVEQHPDEGIPEFQFLDDREWLSVVEPSYGESHFKTQMELLKSQAIGKFAGVMQGVLQKYAQANNGQFPSDLSQLQPYCDPNVETILQQRYEIKPASILPRSTVKDLDIKTDWVIAGKQTIASNTGDYIAIWANGESYFWH